MQIRSDIEVKILVEPVFVNTPVIMLQRIITKELTDSNETTDKIAYNIITSSLITSEFYFKVKFTRRKRKSKLKSITIQNISIYNENKTFLQTFSDRVVVPVNFEEPVELLNNRFYIIFPSHGVYWLEATIVPAPEDVVIETQQRMPTNMEGRGWFFKKDENKIDFKNILRRLRQPIIVLDSTGLVEIKEERSVVNLTKILTFLAIIQLFLLILSVIPHIRHILFFFRVFLSCLLRLP